MKDAKKMVRIKVANGQEYSSYRLMFGERPKKRRKGQRAAELKARRKANRVARRQRRVNRQRQVPHARKRG